MKTLAILLLGLVTIGCASRGDHEEMLLEGADRCNNICMKNPNIQEFSYKAGGGATLLFMGGIAESCVCNRTDK